MDNLFEPSRTVKKQNLAKTDDYMTKIDPNHFDSQKILNESCEFLIQEYIKRTGGQENRKSFIGTVEYESVHEFLDMQISQLKGILEQVDMEIVQNRVDEELVSNSETEIEAIENLYK